MQRGCLSTGRSQTQTLTVLQGLLADLHLEHKKKQNPPSLAELLKLLCTEEDRQEAKVMRMKQRLGTTKQKAVSHVQAACNCGETRAESDARSIHELRKQVADLKSQITNLMKKKKHLSTQEIVKVTEKQKPETNLPSHTSAPSKPKPWSCFRCW